MVRALDLSRDFTTVIDFQETVTFFSRTGQGTVARGITITNCTRRNPEDGTTGEGTTSKLQRVRFAVDADLSANLTVFLLPTSQLNGYRPKRSDLIVDGQNRRYEVKNIEENQTQIGTFRCFCRLNPTTAS